MQKTGNESLLIRFKARLRGLGVISLFAIFKNRGVLLGVEMEKVWKVNMQNMF